MDSGLGLGLDLGLGLGDGHDIGNFLLGYSSKSNGGSWPKRPKLQKLSLAWDGKMEIKLSDPSLASSLPLHRTSEVFRSDNTSCLIPAWPRVPGYHADPLKSEAMPHSTTLWAHLELGTSKQARNKLASQADGPCKFRA
jgi:hypothetical protein